MGSLIPAAHIPGGVQPGWQVRGSRPGSVAGIWLGEGLVWGVRAVGPGCGWLGVHPLDEDEDGPLLVDLTDRDTFAAVLLRLADHVTGEEVRPGEGVRFDVLHPLDGPPVARLTVTGCDATEWTRHRCPPLAAAVATWTDDTTQAERVRSALAAVLEWEVAQRGEEATP